ncbi:MAG: Imm26 family immunity protein [Bacteroidota bacterium]
MRKKKIWNNGDIFLVPLKNGKFSVGQVLDLQTPNTVRCALYNEIVDDISNLNIANYCKEDHLISLLACSRENLDYGEWKVVGNNPIKISKDRYPNEKYRNNKWDGSSFYSAPVVDSFLNAYNALKPWDDYFDPNFLDELLVDRSMKPINLIYKKR